MEATQALPLSKPLSKLAIFAAFTIGIVSGLLPFDGILQTATLLSESFVKLLKLVSMPIIFFSLSSTLTNMEFGDVKVLGKRILKYTLLTTFLSACIGLGLYLLFISPIQTAPLTPVVEQIQNNKPYLDYLLDAIPSNPIQPFIEGNVLGVLLLAFLLSAACMALPAEQKAPVKLFLSSLFNILMNLTRMIIKLLPIAIWAFMVVFIHDVKNNAAPMNTLTAYLACIVLANLIQSMIILPALLKLKKIRPFSLFKAMLPALNMAFWSKSSSAALPLAIHSAQNRAGISEKVAKFSLPLCTTINMNACAAFIIITVLFVGSSGGITFSPFDLLSWTVIATIAAVGNASVPMGCYFLSSALLAYLGAPLYLLGLILPFYALLDMLESAINVWSDACITKVTDRDNT